MPIYEYTCQDCHTDFEMIRQIKDADTGVVCTCCTSSNVNRQISLFNAYSSGRPVAGSSTCSSCSSGACSTCGMH